MFCGFDTFFLIFFFSQDFLSRIISKEIKTAYTTPTTKGIIAKQNNSFISITHFIYKNIFIIKLGCFLCYLPSLISFVSLYLFHPFSYQGNNIANTHITICNIKIFQYHFIFPHHLNGSFHLIQILILL